MSEGHAGAEAGRGTDGRSADLAVLASPPEAYAAYASAVREEYGHLPDDVFTADTAGQRAGGE